MKTALVIAIIALLASNALAQHTQDRTTHTTATGLIFGSGTILNGTTKPVDQCLYSNGTQIIGMGCNGGNGSPIFTHNLSGTTPVFVVTSATVPAIDVENETLPATLTSITTPAAVAMADGQIIHAKFVQPPGNHSYGLPGTITAGAGTTVVLTSGCPSLPSMPTGTNHALILGMTYDAAITELDVVSCVTTGA